MLNTKKTKFRKILCGLTLAFAFVISAFTGASLPTVEPVKAVSNYQLEDVSQELLSSYYNFSTSSTAQLANPNGWTKITEGSANTENIVSGIADLKNESTFNISTNHTITRPVMPKENQESSYYKNLIINSYSGAGKLGYKSNSFTLAENSYYSISVKLYTHRTPETDPNASIYLTGLTDDEEKADLVKFENINTLTSWVDYTFYVDTDASVSVNLELWLGSKTSKTEGAVFFNEVKIIRYSEDCYMEKSYNEDTTKVISLSAKTSKPVVNSDFEDITPLGWKSIGKSNVNANFVQTYETVDANNFKYTQNGKVIVKTPYSTNAQNNNHVLFMYNEKDDYQGLESSQITIERLQYYKISFWAKSDCNVGKGATVKLVDNTEENPITSASLKTSTTYTVNSNKFRNDWTKYSFYIYGDDLEDKQITIQIWLGTKDEKTSGYVFIDDFRIQDINHSIYSTNSSASNSTTMNFNADTDIFVVTNSDFSKTSNADNDSPYLLTPTSWTKTGTTNNNTFSGVISADKDNFDANKSHYTNNSVTPVRPADHPIHGDNNNVLMIGTSFTNYTQSYTSADISLNADSYYKLSYYVLTNYDMLNEKDNTGAKVAFTSSSKVIYEHYNIHFNDNKWHQFVTYIRTGVDAETAKLSFIFENRPGYVFFDDVKLETTNADTFNNFYKDPAVIYSKVDLTYENFDNRNFNKTYDIDTPNNWTVKSTGATPNSHGIIRMDNILLQNIADTLTGNKNVLYIDSLHDVNYAYESKQSFSLAAQTYYKISVNILTKDITTDNLSDYDYPIGARFGLANSKEIYIDGINTNNQWKTYTIYACLEETLSSAITLGLGTANQSARGKVLFDNLVVTQIDKNTYSNEFESADLDYIKSFINYVEAEETTPEDEKWTNEFNWLIIPSLLTGIALVVSIVGFYFRKINFNKKPKVKTNYDRRKTLDKDIDRREKIALRQQIIDELNVELNAIDKEIEEYNKNAELKLEELKKQIELEKQAIESKKLEIEIKKKEATAQREKQLKEDETFVSNTKAEREYNSFIASLDKQEMKLQKQINKKDLIVESTRELDNLKLAKYIERKEFIKNEIAKIEAEIEEIARQEADMWEEYKKAKQDAKARKAEYKAQLKAEKERNKKSTTSKKTATKSVTKKSETKKTNKTDNNSSK